MRRHKVTRRSTDRAWSKYYQAQEILRLATKETVNEKSRADRLVKEVENYAAVVRDKSEAMSRVQQEVVRKEARIAELIAERDRITKMVTQFLSVQILTSNIETTKALRQL